MLALLRFLAPTEISLSKFYEEVRKHMVASDQPSSGSRGFVDRHAITFVLANNVMLPSSALTMAEVYAKHRDEDGFLYLLYMEQNFFGS